MKKNDEITTASAPLPETDLIEAQTQIVVLQEYDVKKNGRFRKVALEIHKSPLPETEETPEAHHAFHEKVFLRISKKRFVLFGKGNSNKTGTDVANGDGDEDDASMISLDTTNYSDHTGTQFNGSVNSTSPSRKNPDMEPKDVLSVIPESKSLSSKSLSSPGRGTSSTSSTKWITSYVLDLKKVEIVGIANKRVTLRLRYKPDTEPRERHFVFHLAEDARSFVDTIERERINEKERDEKKFLSSIEAAGIKSKVKNLQEFREQQLEFLVEIVGAEDLAIEDITSSDPFVVAQFGDRTLHRTKYVSKNLNPVFTLRHNAFFLWSISTQDLFIEADGLTLMVYDFDLGGKNELLGATTVPAKDIYNANEERRCYPLKALVVGNRTRGHNQGKIAIRIRRATDYDKEFLENYKKYERKREVSGVLDDQSKKSKGRGEHGASALRSFIETKKRTFIDEDGCKVYKYKTMPRPDPENTTATEWMSEEEIELAVMKPSRHFEYVGSGKLAKIYLEILACDDLPNMEGQMGRFGNKTDGFVQIVYEDCICKTEVIDDKNNPRFLPWTRRAFVLHTNYPSSVINLGVFDYDPGVALFNDHDLIGRASVDITNLRSNTEYILNYTLYNTALLESKRRNFGTIKIRLRLEVEDPKAYLLASLKLPPPIYVNSSCSKDFECVHQTCYGEFNMARYSIDYIAELVDELLKYQHVYYYLHAFLRDMLLWRGSHDVSVVGRTLKLPVNSLCMFFMATTVVEKPRLLPSYSFLFLGFVLMTSMGWRNNHPNPWRRCPTFVELLKVLLYGKAAAPQPEMIAVDENAAEAVQFENSWKELIDSAEKKAAARAIEIANEQEMLQKELEEIGGANAEISSNLGPKVTLDPRQALGRKYLFPVQQALLQACEWIRFLRNIFLWEESYYSFWVTLVSFVLSIVFIFVPWIFLIRWTSRIVTWTLFGPWMKLLDVYLAKANQRSKDDELKAEEADRLGRKKQMEKTIEEARIRNELAFKLRAFKQYFFGKFLTKVPILKVDRFIDLPLPSSSARPYVKESSIVATRAFNKADSMAQKDRGQHLEGVMIPRLKTNEERTEIAAVESSGDNAQVATMKIGGFVCAAAVITYFLVPILIHAVKVGVGHLSHRIQ